MPDSILCNVINGICRQTEPGDCRVPRDVFKRNHEAALNCLARHLRRFIDKPHVGISRRLQQGHQKQGLVRVAPLAVDERPHGAAQDAGTLRKCDVILPLVAIATPGVYITKPLGVFELDFEANLRVIRWCVEYNKRVIFPSTSEVYGMATDEAFKEHATNLILGPIEKQRWIYSCCKQLMDRLLYAYGFEKDLRYTIFRPFNFIGAKLDDIRNDAGSRIVTQFLHNALHHQPLQLVDGGHNRRCFTYIDDGIDCLLRIIQNENGCADREIFNIGNPNENYSVTELSEILKEILQEFDPQIAKTLKIESISAEDYYGKGYQDVTRRVPSIEAAKIKLGWEPKTSLREALRHILNYHFSGIDPDALLLKNT